MGNNVFANGREVSCKAADGKSICSFPDVCFTPPENPATPPGVPIPYPNTGMAKDTAGGSKKVKVSGKETMLKNQSHFKKSMGDEAGSAAKKGVITSVNRGKIYFTCWSMDVKFEGKNIVRHMDMTTHNHASQIGNASIPWLYADSMSIAIPEECKEEQQNFKDKCKKHIKEDGGTIELSSTNSAMCEDGECKEARACVLLPKSLGCCDGKTGHHLIPNSLLQTKRGGPNDIAKNVDGLNKTAPTYTEGSAPCCCVVGSTQNPSKATGEHTEHSLLHARQKEKFEAIMETEDLSFEKVKKASAQAHTEAIKDSEGKPKCDAACLEAQMKVYFDRVSEGGNADKIDLRQKNGSTNKVYREGL